MSSIRHFLIKLILHFTFAFLEQAISSNFLQIVAHRHYQYQYIFTQMSLILLIQGKNPFTIIQISKGIPTLLFSILSTYLFTFGICLLHQKVSFIMAAILPVLSSFYSSHLVIRMAFRFSKYQLNSSVNMGSNDITLSFYNSLYPWMHHRFQIRGF